MRAAAFVYGEDGSPTTEVRELNDPDAGPGEAVVRVEACSLNRSSIWQLQGAEFEEPMVSGSDVAGVVESLGPGAAETRGLAEGDRAVLCPNVTCGACPGCREGPETRCHEFALYRGGFAERCVVEAERLVSLPDTVSFVEASVLPIVYMTARRMLGVAGVESGDRVFVPGATGGVGVAAVQLADVLGAEVVGTTGSVAKAERLPALGVDHVVVSDDPDELREELPALPAFDAVLNHLGGPFTAVGLEALRRGGTMVCCGMTAGWESTVEVATLAWDQKRILGSTMGTQEDLSAVVDLVADGTLDVETIVHGEYGLDEVPDAFEAMEGREHLGKLVVRPGR